MPVIQIFLFIIATGVILYVSRRSLRNPRCHGFYRFFAWEAIASLVILNLPRWFLNPFSAPQLLSWILLLVCFIPLVQGVLMLKKMGRSQGKVESSANYAFENTTHLVREGVYRYIRHPLYASLLYLAWGAYLKDFSSILSILLVLAATIFLVFTARAEEAENMQAFGQEYAEYMKTTRRFIPLVF